MSDSTPTLGRAAPEAAKLNNRPRDRLLRHWPHRRTRLKMLHLAMIPLFAWFFLVTPQDVAALGVVFVQLHSVLGLIFVTLALVWTLGFLRGGLAGRPGPKLPPWARRLHPVLHKSLIWGIFGVALTGFGLGLTSAVLLWAGGLVPIAPPLNLPEANALVGTIHTVEFYIVAALAVFHASFHTWRHLHLRDNCLRIMAPRFLHRWL